MKRWQKITLAISGAIPLLGLAQRPPDPMLLIYSVFVMACLLRGVLSRWCASLPGGPQPQLIGTFLCAGTLTEILAWMNNYLKAAPEPALFHPQLFADLVIGIGFYGGWAVAWLIALRWFRFNLAELFLVTGLQGIFFEQLGAVFRAMLKLLPTQPALAFLFGLYVFAVHGSAAALGACPVLERFDAPGRTRHWVRFPLVVGLMVGLAFLGCVLVGAIAALLGGLPPKQSIIEHPFW